MSSIVRHLVQARMSGEFSDDILHRKGFAVNIRLFFSSSKYRNVVLGITRYMSDLMNNDYDDYAGLQGISGANIGVPFNIVGIRSLKNINDNSIVVMKGDIWFLINPKITEKSVGTHMVESNCGSIRLPKKIKVKRHDWVNVEYYDLSGENRKIKIGGAMGCTLQHEVDHNLGILITDKDAVDDKQRDEGKSRGGVSLDRPLGG